MPKNDFKTMDLNEFTSSGLLQEVNRRILHPMGLALYVMKDDGGQVIGIGGVIDNRDDPVGMVFPELTREHFLRYQNVQDELDRRLAVRQARLGFGVQPIPGAGEAAGPPQEKSITVATE